MIVRSENGEAGGQLHLQVSTSDSLIRPILANGGSQNGGGQVGL